jgi:hypothetical protein
MSTRWTNRNRSKTSAAQPLGTYAVPGSTTNRNYFEACSAAGSESGLSAAYLVVDAWFGCKENIALALDSALIGIFQMKRGKQTHRYQVKSYTAAQWYTRVQRRM